ncbi:hypothetical protein BO82DRAFT_352848 [Aspergillus uvarum CBS 121591]|uniref:Uncharacterized protein n=1 Tax=Aspergillus uvarum CBS 121591 TaxID=1448315 RepID=A0A319CJU6_9EURO|nr:hypothetical protein BO82DRAFT_352848 [Aspergillus uvarum CBS 121591]PYH83437.1 hypothetical protein BO82DRAFT_352848 [Aspergillus uvarum CBS 121591]
MDESSARNIVRGLVLVVLMVLASPSLPNRLCRQDSRLFSDISWSRIIDPYQSIDSCQGFPAARPKNHDQTNPGEGG